MSLFFPCFEKYTTKCREKDSSLTEEWHVYFAELIPRNAPTKDMTHVLLKGKNTKIAQTGKNKGKRIWSRDKETERKFIFDLKDFT